MLDTMVVRDIRQTLEDFRRSIDQFFANSIFTPSRELSTTGAYAFTPAVESFWNDREVVLRAILPGVSAEDVKVSVQEGRLVLEGERKLPEGWGENAQTVMAYGKFYATIPVPSGLDLDKVTCRLHDGILEIHLPVTEALKPRQIPIETGVSQKAIGAAF
jgi:HSP20 family protein